MQILLSLQFETTDCSSASGVGGIGGIGSIGINVGVGGGGVGVGNMRALSGASASDLLQKHTISSLLEQHQQQDLLGRRNDASDGLINFINGECAMKIIKILWYFNVSSIYECVNSRIL